VAEGGEIRGRTLRNFERPDWGPLIELAPEYLDEFIWMFEVESGGGTLLHAYRHRETRRYLYLDQAKRAYVYLGDKRLTADDDGLYRQVNSAWLIRLATDAERAATFVCGNVLSEFKRIHWARSAGKHRVPRRCARAVMGRCHLRFVEPPPANAPAGASERLVFVGDDDQGQAFEVMAVEPDGAGVLLVIHAMELRDKYRLDYEEASRWQG
jgi:hypothetical protein